MARAEALHARDEAGALRHHDEDEDEDALSSQLHYTGAHARIHISYDILSTGGVASSSRPHPCD